MNVDLPSHLGLPFKSFSQQARLITETWASESLFCPACSANKLDSTASNTKAVDFECPRCDQKFQLKSKSSPITDRVVDGAYETMLAAVRSDTAPNLYLLHYDRINWRVLNLILVPHFACPPSALLKRNPLSSTARRAGWIGCFIVLSNIPTDARIPVVRGGESVSSESVRAHFRRLLPLKEIAPKERGWTLDVLNVIRGLGKTEFTNADLYAFIPKLAELHPENRHIADKIRQQLQFLRDKGFLLHTERTVWRLISPRTER